MSYLSTPAVLANRVLRIFFTVFVLCALGRTAFAQVPLPRPPGEQQLQATTEEMSNPVPANPPTMLHFGASLAMDGRTLLVGMPAYSTESMGAPPDAGGRVAVFSLNEANRWVRSGTIDPATHTPGDRFGAQMALGGNFAMVGARSGIFVFKRKSDTWKQVGKLVPAAGEHYIGGLAISRGLLMIGVAVENAPGRVYVFAQRPEGELLRVQQLQASSSGEDEGFGVDLAASGGTLVVGAPGFAEGQGAAFVYRQAGHKWVLHRRLVATDQDPAPALGPVLFGAAVDIDDNLIIVGAPGADRHDTGGLCPFLPSGAAYVFARSGKRLEQTQKISSADLCSFDFAATVAISRDYLVAGAPSAFPYVFDGAHIFQRTDDVYTQRYFVFGSEVSVPRLALEGSHFVAGFPADRFFSTGFALAYDLAEAP